MNDRTYRPWRQDQTPNDGLAESAAADWQSLLAETRRQVAELRQLKAAIDQRLKLGSQLLAHLSNADPLASITRLEQRLTAIEQRLAVVDRTPAPPIYEHPSVSGRNSKAA